MGNYFIKENKLLKKLLALFSVSAALISEAKNADKLKQLEE